MLRPLVYRLHPVLAEATPIETLYEVRLACKVSAAAHIRALLLSTITPLPVTLQSLRGEQDELKDETNIRAEMATAGRNNGAIEQVVMRLSIEDDVSTLSWSIIEAAMEWNDEEHGEPPARRNERITARLRGIQGQLASLQRSLSTDAYHALLLQRVAAARGGMSGLMAYLMEDRLRTLQLDPEQDNANEAIEEMIDVVHCYLK
jgi:DNA-binding FrmR family transcriptional regulator